MSLCPVLPLEGEVALQEQPGHGEGGEGGHHKAAGERVLFHCSSAGEGAKAEGRGEEGGGGEMDATT